MVKIRTKKGKNGRTYRYPIKNGGSSDYIQKAVNKKYGVEYSLWKDKSGLMVYKLEPSEGKPVRYESPKSKQ